MSKRKSTKHCCFVLFVVHLAHSYPDGAPLVAITGQVGCTAGYDHSPFPVSSLPQSRLALQGNKKRRFAISREASLPFDA